MRGNFGEIRRQRRDEQTGAVVVSPGNPARLELAENRRRGNGCKPDRVRLEAIVRAGEGEQTIRNRRSEHRVKIAICDRVVLRERPIVPELPTIVVTYGDIPQTTRLRLRDHCKEVV